MLFEKALEYSRSTGIDKMLADTETVIVGYSGGADSSVLLSFFIYLKSRFPKINVVAAHMNHMIRGDEADGDESFCRNFCLERGIAFECTRADIPEISKKSGAGLEECARNERYAFFERLSEKYGGALIATAHNGDDNLETVIFNLVRGSGTKGLSGIAPVRDGKYIRPLLSCTSEEIRAFAKKEGIPYVTDSTNADTAYTRNSIRHGVLPTLRKQNPKAAEAALRLSRAAREDCDFIEKEAEKLLLSGINRERLRSLHPALFQRVLLLLYRERANTASDLSEKNVRDCRELILSTESGCISLPRALAFFADKNEVFIATDPRFEDKNDKKCPQRLPLIPDEECIFGDFCICITRNAHLIDTKRENVYNLSLHAALDCDKINGDIFVRARENGDTVRKGKMTKKLKKLLCDADVPVYLRDRLPILEDGDGIVYVPFIGARDGCSVTKETEKIINLHIYERR